MLPESLITMSLPPPSTHAVAKYFAMHVQPAGDGDGWFRNDSLGWRRDMEEAT